MSTTQKPTALVTGVSSGIGKATALALISEGYTVFGTSRRADVGASSDGIQLLKLDVTDDQSVADAVDAVIQKTGRIDLLVNNAGFGVIGGAEESSIVQAKGVFETNLFGVIRMSRAVLPIMRKQGAGRIINISSVLGFIPNPYMALYVASKHALEGYSESLDHEVRTFGVRVLLVQPGYTKTSFEANMVASDEPLPEYKQTLVSVKKLIAGVMAKADDPKIVAKAIVLAASALKPKVRYPAGGTAKQLSFLRRFIPATAFDKTLRKQMKLAPTNG